MTTRMMNQCLPSFRLKLRWTSGNDDAYNLRVGCRRIGLGCVDLLLLVRSAQRCNDITWDTRQLHHRYELASCPKRLDPVHRLSDWSY